MARPTLYLGADHNGFRLKEKLKAVLVRAGVAVHDLGARELRAGDHYPRYAAAVARAVATGRGEGLLICGSGHGMAIAANRFRGVRAALCSTPSSAFRARRDDFANILVLAAWETTLPQAKIILRRWQKTKPSTVPRYRRRVQMIERLSVTRA